MGFKVNTKRVFTIEYTHEVEMVEEVLAITETEAENGVAVLGVPAKMEKFELSVTIQQIASEDVDYGELRKKMESVSDTQVIINEESGKTMDNGSYNAFLYTLRKSIVACKGFVDQDEKDLVITATDGKVNNINQIVVAEAIKQIPDFYDKIIAAYTGISSKN
jgi:hypothetical protein